MVKVLTGNEPYIIDKKISELKNTIKFPEMNLTISDDINEDVINIIKCIPMVDEKRVVIISLPEVRSELKDIIEITPDTTDVYIVLKDIDKKTKFYKHIQKENLLIECNKLNERQLKLFVLKLLNEKYVKITDSAYSLLIERLNYFEDPNVSLYTVEICVRQLMYLSSIITEKEIHKVVMESSNEKIYMLTKSLLSRNYNKAVSLSLEFIDRGENIIGLLSMMLRVFRLAYKATLYNDMDQAELGSLLGVPIYQFKDALKISENATNMIIDIIQEAINNIKTGRCGAINTYYFTISKIIEVIKNDNEYAMSIVNLT